MISDLYQKNILGHAASADGAGRLPQAHASADLRNPLCGDHVIVDISVEDGKATALGHELKACVVCQASAAILARNIPGSSAAELQTLFDDVSAMLKEGAPGPKGRWETYGDLSGVAAYGNRHRCVLLPIEAAIEAFATLCEE